MNLRNIERKAEIKKQKYDISGKTILLTGRIPKYTRTTIESTIRKLGGYILVNRFDADIVVYTRTDTTKYEKALTQLRYKKTMLFIKGEDFVRDYLRLEGDDDD